MQPAFIENLESRQLLAATPTVGVYTGRTPSSESDPSQAGRGSFLIKRAVRTSKALTVEYYVAGRSTAKNTTDFQTLTGTITIPPHKYSALVHIVPVDDASVEETELVNLVVKPGSYTIGRRHASLNIEDNDASTWFGDARRYRSSFTIDSGSAARSDQPVDRSINFTDVLSDLGTSGSLVNNSIKLVETTADGTTVINGNVPYQFDEDGAFNASSHAAGNLVLLLAGVTPANTTRHFQVYFDTTGSYSAPSFSALVVTSDNQTDQGQAAIKIDTQTATYWLQKANGGFSSIEDKSANHPDWLSFNPTPNSHAGGEYRGTPNAVNPGGGFHAGFNNGTMQIIHSGPLKVTIESTVSVDKQINGSPFDYKMRYEIYGKFVRATILQAENSYWFLYEGTPGGSVDGNDSVVRSDGTTTSITTTWDDNDGLGNGADAAGSNGEEWVYFRDSSAGKYIYFVHNQTDTLKDTYYHLNDNGEMTVFGFGRDNAVSDPDRQKLTAESNTFTFGIADGGGVFSSAAAAIRGVYKDVAVSDLLNASR